MKAMLLDGPGGTFGLGDVETPVPGPGEVRVQVHACGVCRTDLHIVDGDLTEGRYPIVPGHQIVGTVDACGVGVTLAKGTRVGIPWLGGTCGSCGYCLAGRENLCDHARFTGYHRHGGFAEYAVADQRFCFPLPDGYSDLQVAPLLCAGLIGYRAYAMAGKGTHLGMYGFGSAAHILTQIAVWQGRRVYAVTRDGDTRGRAFARGLGACWAGGVSETPPHELDAAIIFAPAGELVPLALHHVRKGGSVICAGIHMSRIPGFEYADLWGERCIRSVANLTRADGVALLELAPRVPVRTTVTEFALSETASALDAIREGSIEGSAVVVVGAEC